MDKQKKIYIGTNTKMYQTIKNTKEFLQQMVALTEDMEEDLLQLFVIPSYTALETAGRILHDSKIMLGAQNMCWNEGGAFTGEISPGMLLETGVQIVAIGHSERRIIFHEKNWEEERKVKAAVENGMIPLLCIGETMEEKNYGISDEVLAVQLKTGLHSLPENGSGRFWIAYEPVWAIGEHGVPAEEAYLAKRHASIRSIVRELFGKEAGEAVPVLYGGGVTLENAAGIAGLPNVDGLFIGRSAWHADNFNRIIRTVLSA